LNRKRRRDEEDPTESEGKGRIKRTKKAKANDSKVGPSNDS